ncbi:prepilin peptidase [Woodsholea maritima]|uniref:prepilin peptidase n=1 Tax=Woodsholea maritima TaxID=240237 RepID=UPI000379642F|nr:A24 family peptidase [Woodsholea maritima]
MVDVFLLTATLFIPLTALAYIDARTGYLPNTLVLPLIPVGISAQFLLGQSPLSSLIGAGLGYGLFVGIEKGYKALRGVEGLGRGDAKLFAVGGAWCGAMALPMIGVLAGISGLGYALILHLLGRGLTRTSSLVLGPHLALAIGCTWILKAWAGPYLGLSLT